MFSCLRKKSSCTCVLGRWTLTNTSWITTMLEHHTKMITEQKSVQLTSVSISLTLWQEVTRVEKSRSQLRRWDALRHELTEKEVRTVGQSLEEMGRVEDVARGEESWGELRRVKTEVIGESWEEQGRGEKSWGEGGEMEQLWELLKRVAKIEKSWDGLKKAETWWSQLKRDEAKWRRTQRTELRSCVKFRGSSYRQNLFSGSYSSTLLIIGNFRQPACPGFTCIKSYLNIFNFPKKKKYIRVFYVIIRVSFEIQFLAIF